ncbi:MAG: alpha-1,2-fucosyltransferase [Candidatus Binataceae bacterium]
MAFGPGSTKFDAAAAKRGLATKLSDTFLPVRRGNKLVTFRFLGHLGRLGNQLFQIAAAIGVARKNSCPFILPEWDYARHFANPYPSTSARPRTRRLREQAFNYQNIVIDRPTELYGYFQSERYFQHCADEIRGYLQPHPALAAMLEDHFRDLLARNTCSVHVRRGDYVGHPDFVDLSATDYYARAFAQFGPDTTFVVFSDDPQWCRARFGAERFIYIEALSDIEDLFLMSLCRDHIIANSSMSWWGAWRPSREKSNRTGALVRRSAQ